MALPGMVLRSSQNKRSKMAGAVGKLGSSRLVRSSSGQKSREYRESSDSDDDELFDGEKLKTRLMSMWNNMRHGGLKGCKTSFVSYNVSRVLKCHVLISSLPFLKTF